MKTLIAFLLLTVSLTSHAQQKTWGGTTAVLYPNMANGFKIYSNGSFSISNQTNKLSMAGGVLLLDGSAIPAAAGTLTGATLASGVTASSLTSVGTLGALTVTAPIAGSVTGASGSTTGNAATATALATPRAINGTAFNGTAAITVTSAAGTLTGATLSSGVTASSLTSVGTLGTLTVTAPIAGSVTGNAATVTTIPSLSGDVSSSGNTVTIVSGAVTLAKMANLAQDQFIGRTTASTGVPETTTITAFARTILDDTTAAAVRTTIGAGTGSGDALVANPLSQFASTTSAQLAGIISNETGSGSAVFSISPTFVSPTLGVASSTSEAITGTNGAGFASFVSQSSPPSAPASGFSEFADSTGRKSWRRASDGFVRTWDATLTADRVYTLPDASVTIGNAQTSSALSQFASTTSAQLSGVLSDETGTGLSVFNNSPTFVSPTLGVASSTSEAITGTNGAGFASFVSQSSPPSAPASGFSEFADSTGRKSWRRASDGFTRTFDATLTANRVYTLPDASITFARSDAAQTISGDQTFSGRFIDSQNGALSAPAGTFTGTWITGGTATTTKPMFLIEPSGTTSTAWVTTGTGLGINAVSSFVGNYLDFQQAGVTKLYVSIDGTVTSGGQFRAGAASLFTWLGRSTMKCPSDGTILFGNDAANGFTRLQLGPDVAAPSAVTLDFGSVVAGTSNTAGANATITGSQSTGAGTGGSIILQTSPAGSTGTAQNALTTALTISGEGNLLQPAGKTFSVATGTNQRAGVVTLTTGSVTVSNATVTTNTLVFPSRKSSGGTVGMAITWSASAGSFTITSDNVLDTSSFAYFLIENP